MNFNDSGIYIHVPFCSNKCFYCDYASIITKNKNMVNNYFDALEKEISLYKSYKIKIKTIYIGGGTPSFVESRHIKNIVNKIREYFDTKYVEEFTIEMNPENVTEQILKDYKEIGVNRISLGIQSLENRILKLVNRKNDNQTAENAVKKVKRYFNNYNLDFILGLPEETELSVKKNLDFISKLNPPHISYYIYDNNHDSILNKMLKNKKISLPDQEKVEEFADLIYDYFEKNNYNRYEISSWAIFGKESLHNKIYWENSNYIGFGISAGGYYNSIRYVNTKNFSHYIDMVNKGKKPYEYFKKNDKKEDLIEMLFMGLRLTKGIPTKRIKNIYPEYYENIINFLKKEDLFEIDDHIKLTKKGLDYSSKSFEKILEMRDIL